MRPISFRQRGEHIELLLLGDDDAPWIAALIDEVEASVGRPWRELLDRIERLPARASPARHAAVVQAIRALLGGRARGGVAPAAVRHELFGSPALEPAERDRRFALAATGLGMSVPALERIMWADLPGERMVVLPHGRPDMRAVAAAANLAMVQRALLHCHELRLRLSGNARAVVRTAAVRGLLATARMRGDDVVIEISGPLALFHRTTVYGRALGSLVPHLAWCERFVLEARCDFGRGPATLRLQPPLLLPPGPAPRRYDSAVEARFARDMAKLAPGWRVVREPAAIAAGTHLAFPDFLLEHREVPDRRWWLEIVGFWTSAYLASKLATYRSARLSHVILCIDAKRSIEERDLPADAQIVRFEKHVPVAQVLAIVEGARDR